jgi:hypothetical protein
MSDQQTKSPLRTEESFFIDKSPVDSPLVQEDAAEVVCAANVGPWVFLQEWGGEQDLGRYHFDHTDGG